MRLSLLFFTVAFFLGLLFITCQKPPVLDSYQTVLSSFQNPPAEFRSAPLWVWNDAMTKEQIDTQLADFQAHGIGGVFIHPRPGLITPYLSDEWLSLCRYTVDVGKKLGMKIWIYDENSYPSGFAGGHVPAQMPDAARCGLRMARMTELPKTFAKQPLVILQQTETGFVDITQKAQQQSAASGNYCVFDTVRQHSSPWYGGFTYVDLMRKEVTEKFIDVTMNAYKRVIGDEFGKTVPGVFQDEAEINPAGGKDVIHYTPALFAAFEKKWGYDLRVNLPSLYEDVGDWKRVRHNFYATLLDLFVENWSIPYYDYCTKHKLAFTGHYWEHEWPTPRVSPDNMAMYAYAHQPGIDILMNEFKTDPHAQFGNARSVRELRSVANQLGKKRTLSETYGAGGWDFTFFDQKREGDWEFALGVNFLCQHLSYVTIKGARKRDHPQSFSYHEPWWRAYGLLADYFGRLTIAMSHGEQQNRILVIEPTTSAWMHYARAIDNPHLNKMGEEFQNFVHQLEAAQIEYDLGSEAILKDHGKAHGGKFIVGQREYDLVVLPPGTENLNAPTVALLENYLQQNGKILSWVGPPSYVDGQANDAMAKLNAQHKNNYLALDPAMGLDQINQLSSPKIEFVQPNNYGGLLFHHRRVLQDAELLFLTNISDQQASAGQFMVKARSIEKWDLFAGKVSAYPSKREKGKLLVDFALPPGGSVLLCMRPTETTAPLEAQQMAWEQMTTTGETKIVRQAPNVLTLDYCDLNLSGNVEKDLYFYQAQLKTYQHHGLPRNPWDSAVQYKTNILDLDKFAPESGFEATYWFTAANGVNLASLQAVVERPQLFQVAINGQVVRPKEKAWWLDKAFGVFEIGQYARVGANKITLKASPFTIHSELEPVYLLGDFMLKAGKKGFELVPAKPLNLGAWDEQGMPFYATGVAYQKTVEIPTAGNKKSRYRVQLGSWKGAVAEVKVGEKSAGFIAFQPFELDITNLLAPGANTVSVIVYGTLKNTLGPHHNNPPLGRAWPGSFQQGAKDGYPPGSEYSVVGYGLMDDFKIQVGKEL